MAGAAKWRNPDQDLPADFDQYRGEHYTSLADRSTRCGGSGGSRIHGHRCTDAFIGYYYLLAT